MTQVAAGAGSQAAVDESVAAENLPARRSMGRDIAAILGVFAVIIALWYVGAIYYNWGSLALHYSDLGQSAIWQHMSFTKKSEPHSTSRCLHCRHRTGSGQPLVPPRRASDCHREPLARFRHDRHRGRTGICARNHSRHRSRRLASFAAEFSSCPFSPML